MRRGVLGGTFDPPHVGHLILADQCAEALQLDVVLLVPALRPPHKRRRRVTAFSERVALLRAAVRGASRLRVSTIEGSRGGLSYTVDTLAELRRRYPEDSLWLLLGADSLTELASWREPERIAALARIAVYGRAGTPAPVTPPFVEGRVRQVTGPGVDVSSSEIRRRVRRGVSVRYLVPPAVAARIARRGLYGAGAS